MAHEAFYFVVVVDMEAFGQRADPVQASLREAMYQAVGTAFDDVRLDGDAVVKLDRGDGILMLVPPHVADSVVLAGRFVDALDRALRQQARMYSAEHRMRMRVALHQGICAQDRNGWVGAAINTTARLVDAQPLRGALASAPDAAMAFIVSDEIYRGVVRHGHRYIDPADFARVAIAVKEVREDAWIRVPGYANPPAAVPAGPEPPAAPPAAPPGAGPGEAHHPQVSQGDYVAGDKFSGDKVAGNVYHFGNPG